MTKGSSQYRILDKSNTILLEQTESSRLGSGLLALLLMPGSPGSAKSFLAFVHHFDEFTALAWCCSSPSYLSFTQKRIQVLSEAMEAVY